MKKMANDCVDTDEFYAVRRTHFPNYWLSTLGGYHNGPVDEVCDVLAADKFCLSPDGRKAAERFAKENDGEVVLVAVRYRKSFYYPSKLKEARNGK